MSLCPVKRLFPTSFVVATLLLCLHGCVVPRYTVADTHCGDFGRGTVYALKSGNRWHGAVFDKDCLIFPGPQFKTRFTPTTDEIRRIDRILRENLPELKIRVVNVVDLMKLQPHTEHPHGLTDAEYDTLFTKDKPIIFAYHGYPTLIHELTYRRHNRNLHVRGYKEEGTITTPFDMRVLNDIDRFDLVIDTVQRLPQLGNRGAYLIQKMNDKLVEHRQYIKDNGVDLPEVRAWKWNDGKGVEV